MVHEARVEVEGGPYQVDNRIASGEPVFSVPQGAIELIRETKGPDVWAILVWCVMPNHDPLVICTETVALSRGMHRIRVRGGARSPGPGRRREGDRDDGPAAC
jgi:hypothetical protein